MALFKPRLLSLPPSVYFTAPLIVTQQLQTNFHLQNDRVVIFNTNSPPHVQLCCNMVHNIKKLLLPFSPTPPHYKRLTQGSLHLFHNTYNFVQVDKTSVTHLPDHLEMSLEMYELIYDNHHRSLQKWASLQEIFYEKSNRKVLFCYSTYQMTYVPKLLAVWKTQHIFLKLHFLLFRLYSCDKLCSWFLISYNGLLSLKGGTSLFLSPN